MAGGLAPAALAAAARALVHLAGASATATRPRDPRGDRRPYPGDGSNGPNVLAESGVVRSDITKSFGASGVADGVPTTVEMTLLDVASGGAPLAGAAVYLWHCDQRGPLLALRPDRRRELPARRPGERRRRQAHVQDDLPRRLHGPLAAHALRGVREPRRGHAAAQAPHLAAGDPEDACEPVYATAGYEQSVETSPRSRSTATWSSATATRASSRRPPAASTSGITLKLNVGV